MNCVICKKDFPNRVKGDHVLQVSLGEFVPELVCKNICVKCDNGIGARIETDTAIKAFNGFYRGRLKIYNPNHRGRKRLYNPVNDTANKGANKFFSMDPLDSRLPVKINDNGDLVKLDSIEFKYKNNIYVRYFEIPDPIYMADKIWDLVDRRKGYELKIMTDKPVLFHIGEILKVRFKRSTYGEDINVDKSTEIVRCVIDAKFDEHFYRGVSYAVIKLINFLGMKLSPYGKLLNFIRGTNALGSGIKIKPGIWSNKILTDNVDKGEFWHQIFFNVSNESIHCGVVYFGHRDAGIVHEMFCSSERTDDLIFPGNYRAIFSFMDNSVKIFSGERDITKLHTTA